MRPGPGCLVRQCPTQIPDSVQNLVRQCPTQIPLSQMLAMLLRFPLLRPGGDSGPSFQLRRMLRRMQQCPIPLLQHRVTTSTRMRTALGRTNR